jgi:hypothetical protein
VGDLGMDYKWVFDGIGGVAITLAVAGIIGAIKLTNRWRKKRAEANAPKPRPVYARISALTAEEVWQAIDKAPVLHRHSVHKQYIGTVVRWQVHLMHIYPDDKGWATLDFSCRDPSLEVVCEVRLSEYPELNYANYETPIVVTGKVGMSKYSEIGLDDVALEFPTKSPEVPRRPTTAISHAESIAVPNYGDVLTSRLLLAAPVLNELKEQTDGRPLAVVAIIRDKSSETLAKEILEYLKAHNFPLKRPILTYIFERPTQSGVYLIDRGEHIDVLVAP